MAFDSIVPEVVDSMERAFSRMLLVFRNNSPILIDVLQAFISEVQELQDAINDVIRLRGPADAFGEQLDGIGRIVGQKRDLNEGGDVNEGYRNSIEAKIFRNFTQFGSVPEIKEMALRALNTYIGFTRSGPMDVNVVVLEGTSPEIVNKFIEFQDTVVVDKDPFLPYPETMRVMGVTHLPEDYFAPDVMGKAPDISKVAVTAQL